MGLNKKLDDTDKRWTYVRTRFLGTGTAAKVLLESTANTVPGVKVLLGRMFSLILGEVFYSV